MDLEGFCLRIGYRFTDFELLRRALTHRSHGVVHNERLEFLGDGVLNCVVAFELYSRFPDLSEGELHRLRANLVNQHSLAAIAQQSAFGSVLQLGEGELKSGVADRPSILADAVEAVIGAAFLDGGFDAARTVTGKLLGGLMQSIDPTISTKDPKTLLQEYLQGRKLARPQYVVVATLGGAHERLFQVECMIPELGIRSQGEGANRRSAEQEAARQAYDLALRA